ncbi:MAG: hypothetical protein D6692_04415 [Planctomycetota bacterium]|nr:MAG: hypothetical protein D6692_04415 [Planctomycetota bacterium]
MIRDATIPLACMVTLTACQPRGVVVREQVVRVGEGLVMPGPFSPKAMRVHPLTHAELDADGTPRVILHIELKDAWGDSVKGVGRVQAQLWRDGQSPENATRYDVDLRALDDNATFYDPATRTYRIVLGGLPAWLDQTVRAESGPNARLRVLFLTSEVDGTPLVLRDEFVVTP